MLYSSGLYDTHQQGVMVLFIPLALGKGRIRSFIKMIHQEGFAYSMDGH